MNCPKCNHEMTTQSAAGVFIDRCQDCGGIWLDAMEAEKLHQSAGVEATGGRSTASSPTPPANHELQCPRCKTAMMTLVVEGKTPVYFENCGTCYGVFLDAGELNAIQAEPLEKWLRATIPGVFRLRFPTEE